MNLSEVFLDYLVTCGYSRCFFVPGGNIMHLLNAARTRFECIPTVHEVSAVIAAEYANEVNPNAKSFALVTAGPGLTNSVTGIAGAWLESRFVLIVGGQVKSTDLSNGMLRQRGIQELDGVSLVKSITKTSHRVDSYSAFEEIPDHLSLGVTNRPGPVFLEFCLDLQAMNFEESLKFSDSRHLIQDVVSPEPLGVEIALHAFNQSTRPILLIGGGISRSEMPLINDLLGKAQIPTMTTWNAADRIDSGASFYFGRPNTWGQRYSNILLQQCDLLIAVGTRLGLQQVGFNHENFAPRATIIQIDKDEAELHKGFPHVDHGFGCDGNTWIKAFLSKAQNYEKSRKLDWIEFANLVKQKFPLSEESNNRFQDYVNPYDFIENLSHVLDPGEKVIPCSSGGAFTVFMQSFKQKRGQVIISNKGLASMGYGLAGAIGASFASERSRVILIEGDGGFSQNLQELATIRRNQLPIKILLFDNGGYASIRMTQLNYFDGEYLGCDEASGLGMPDWLTLFDAYQIPCSIILSSASIKDQLRAFLSVPGPGVLLIPIHKDQTYFPKIESRVVENGSMQSNPLHLMSPVLDKGVQKDYLKYLEGFGEQD
jgi:acetolactate synthase-1/2/3 large subunit